MKKIAFFLYVLLSVTLFVQIAGASPVLVKKTETHVFGPTEQCDDLWKIAVLVAKQNQLIPQQAISAIHKANPNAFYKGNINGLLAGYILHIPAKSMMQMISPTQAISFVKLQNRTWKNIVTDNKQQPALKHLLNNQKSCPKEHFTTLKDRFHELPLASTTALKVQPAKEGGISVSQKQSISEQQKIVVSGKKLDSAVKPQNDGRVKGEQNASELEQFQTAFVALHVQNSQLLDHNRKLMQQLVVLSQQNQHLKQSVASLHNQFDQMRAEKKPSCIWRQRLVVWGTLYRWHLLATAGVLLLILMIQALRSLKIKSRPSNVVEDELDAPEKPEDVNYHQMAGEDVMMTKLDLARTYIEMGDAEQALEILKTVAAEGNEEQKITAQELLDSLHS